MTRRLSWNEIEKLYDQEWVELIDYDWPEDEVYPVSGIVKCHGANRHDLFALTKSTSESWNSTVLFVEKGN